ncbi:diguanylate cyclase (GGDEF)-like protein [Lachnotalea glycerini]|uniref:Diguanylate cyclase (GGDEF)-like protein n=1 Tax=Lachnotalea glycerini TaxID=1763509 RepID=A0A255I020_9FIRM|nr:GGDEF domain-containing protein [Lachnotalea glycerini]PXV91810.1 diguanylate cyclase (GGDEF)-like protein [Lachnotalea glycerini]RDY31234.1 GGDEF domain-containing protein [Lachnotalea glycerini]
MQNINFHSISNSRIPIAITDLKLTLQFGNQSFYTLIGNDLFYSIYKVVLPNDRNRLSECIEDIAQVKNIIDVFSILYRDNEYHHMLLNFTYMNQNRLIKIEFQYLSDIIEEHFKLEYEIKKYRTLFTLDGDNIFEYNPETNYFQFYWINDSQNIIRYNGDFADWKQKTINSNLISKVDLDDFMEFCVSIENCKDSFEYQIATSILTDGEIFESTKIKGLTIKNEQDKKIVIGVWVLYNTIYQNKENRFADHLYKDELTGLLNKYEITKYAQNSLKNKPNYTVYLLILDLDNFKQCNDTFGHLFGDDILKAVSTIIKNTIQKHGVVGRIGGDEFLIFLENVETEKLLRNMLRSIRANIQWLYREKLSTFQLGCSMGVSCYPKDAKDYEQLFKLADYSLYIAKNKGKSRYIIYDYNLHGPVTCNENDNSILTQKIHTTNSTLLDIKKKIAQLYCRGNLAMDDVLQALKGFCNLQNITIYIPKATNHVTDMNDNIILPLPILFQAEYLEQFSEIEAYLVTNIKNIEFSFHRIYNYFSQSTSSSYYQCLLRDSNNVLMGIISYERSSVHDIWTNDTKQLLALVSSIISCIVVL